MASTTRRNRTERLFRQGWQFLWPRSFSLPPSPWLRLRGLSWRRLLKRLPLYAGLVMAAGALALVLAASAPRLFGYHTFVIYGGSMAPALRPGDVALTKPVAPEDVQVGDIIASRSNPQASPTLHRVTAIEEEDGQRQFIIKGDRNDGADPEPVLLLGSGDRVVHRLPLAGYLIHFVRTLPGRLLFLALPTLLLAGIILWEIWRPRRAAEAPAPLSASEGPAPEAGPVAVPAPTLEVVVPDLPGARAKAPTPLAASESPAPEAGPVSVAAPTLEVVMPDPPGARAKAPSEASPRAPARPAASGAPKGGRKPRAAGNSGRKGRSTGRKTSRGKSRGQRRAAA